MSGSKTTPDTEVIHLRLPKKHLALAIEMCVNAGSIPSSKTDAIRILVQERLMMEYGRQVLNTTLEPQHLEVLNRFTRRDPAFLEGISPEEADARAERGEKLAEAMRRASEITQGSSPMDELAPAPVPEGTTQLELELSAASDDCAKMIRDLQEEGLTDEMLLEYLEMPKRIIELYHEHSAALDPLDAFDEARKHYALERQRKKKETE